MFQIDDTIKCKFDVHQNCKAKSTYLYADIYFKIY